MERQDVFDFLDLKAEKIEKVFKQNEITFVDQLVKYDAVKLKKMLGKKGFSELNSAMMEKGLFFNSDTDSKRIIDKVIQQTQMVEKMLIFIKDSGAYKRRKLYLLSDVEYNNKMNDFFNAMLTMVLNQVIAEEIVVRLGGESYYKKMLNFVMANLKEKIKGMKNAGEQSKETV